MPRLTTALIACAGACLAVAACATGRGRVEAPEALAPVDRAIEALGGAKQLSALGAVVVRGTVRHWEPEQSIVADGEPRLAGDSTFTAWRALDARAARVEWVRALVYPAPREYRFSEVVTPSAGYVDGNDTTAPLKAAQGPTPRHAMSGVRLAAALRELDRTSPRLLLEARAAPARLSRAPDESVGGALLEVVRFTTGGSSGVTFLLLLDPKSGLPARIRTIDADPIYGDVPYDLVLEDWREVAGVKIAHRQRYELDGREIARIVLQDVQPAAAIEADRLEIPPEIRAAAPPAAKEDVPYQWVLRRQHIGTYLDSDAVSFDPAASSGLRLVDLAPGVAQVVGGTHNSLVVELADRLVVVDAPVGEAQSRVVLGLLRQKYPAKAVRHLVLSHHHMDHVAGARAFVAEGASVVVGAGNGPHFERMFAAPHALSPDALSQHPRKPEIVEVADHQSIGDGRRAVELFRIVNPHAEGLLLVYVRDARIGFAVDIWSPGRDVIGERLTPGQASLVAAVRARGLDPARFAGGHGSVADYAPLAAAGDDR